MARVLAGLGYVLVILSALGFLWTMCLALVIEGQAPFPLNIILIVGPVGVSLWLLGLFLDER